MIEESICPKVRHFAAKPSYWQAIKRQGNAGDFAADRKRTTVRWGGTAKVSRLNTPEVNGALSRETAKELQKC
jgi:hypothetical protein